MEKMPDLKPAPLTLVQVHNSNHFANALLPFLYNEEKKIAGISGISAPSFDHLPIGRIKGGRGSRGPVC